MVAYLLLNKPKDPLPHIVQFLNDKLGTGAPALSNEELAELDQLREEHEKLKTKLKKDKRLSSTIQGVHLSDNSDDEDKKKNAESSGSDDSEEDAEFVANLAPKSHDDKIKMAGRSRTSVSAEVFGKYHIKQAFKPQVIPKSEEVKQKIKARLLSAFMFMSLDEHDLQVVIDAMDEKKCAAGEFVIKEGDAGDCLFIVESGDLKCTKVIGGEEKFLKTY